MEMNASWNEKGILSSLGSGKMASGWIMPSPLNVGGVFQANRLDMAPGFIDRHPGSSHYRRRP
jgi:hypothetical protein